MSDTLRIDFSPVIRAVEVVNDNVRVLSEGLQTVHHNVETVQRDLGATQSKVEQLAQDFYAFVLRDAMDKGLQRAMTDIIRIRQELEKKYGYYDEVRRRTTGILQAVDVSLVRKETITNCTEELMLSAPGYWLAPSLIGLSAWINDNVELSDKAVREALRRDDEKTSLLFALVSRRANRFAASEQWLERYFMMQDPTALEREMVVIIDAFAGGLFGSDSRGQCAQQIKRWIGELSERTSFVEEQHEQWADALLSKMHRVDNSRFQHLAKYSPTWARIDEALSAVKLHQTILNYFHDVFTGPLDTPLSLESAVDTLLDKLVTNFDDEELPLRRQERLTSLIIEEKGDEEGAQQRFSLEQIALGERFSFTQLLTNAAMHPETSHSSRATQRLAAAMSKDWIVKAYENIAAMNRSKIPVNIQISIDGWEGATEDGINEKELLQSLQKYSREKLSQALEKIALGPAPIVLLIVGTAFLLWGIMPPLSYFLIFLGIGAGLYFAVNLVGLNKRKELLKEEYQKHLRQSEETLKAVLGEVVEVRQNISNDDAKYDNVMDYLNSITPQQFISSNYSVSRMISGQAKDMQKEDTYVDL